MSITATILDRRKICDISVTHGAAYRINTPARVPKQPTNAHLPSPYRGLPRQPYTGGGPKMEITPENRLLIAAQNNLIEWRFRRDTARSARAFHVARSHYEFWKEQVARLLQEVRAGQPVAQ